MHRKSYFLSLCCMHLTNTRHQKFFCSFQFEFLKSFISQTVYSIYDLFLPLASSPRDLRNKIPCWYASTIFFSSVITRLLSHAYQNMHYLVAGLIELYTMNYAQLQLSYWLPGSILLYYIIVFSYQNNLDYQINQVCLLDYLRVPFTRFFLPYFPNYSCSIIIWWSPGYSIIITGLF